MNNQTDNPRDCFQVFAQPKGEPIAKGYSAFCGAFDSGTMALNYGRRLADSGAFDWVQVADVAGGQVADFENGVWVTSQANGVA